MNLRARNRVNGWLQEFADWAQVAWKEHDEENDHSEYYLGVIMGIRDARSHMTGPLDGMNELTRQGYEDSRVLINKVIKLGDCPEGDIYDLLSLPYSEPLQPRCR